MNLQPLFKPQSILDCHIVEENNLQGVDTFNRKVVALLCELYETANEARFFKFWSNKKKMNRDKALEEYADTIHFLISIANDLGYESHEYKEVETMDLNELVIGITNMVTLLPEANHHRHVDLIFNHIIKLGYQLGFTEEEVIAAYFAKNKVNHERQEQGY